MNRFQRFFTALLLGSLSLTAQALTREQARAIATGQTDARIEALNKALTDADERTVGFLQALADDAVKVTADQVIIVRNDKGTDPVSGAEVTVPADAEDVVSNNRLRSELDAAMAGLRLFSADDKVRMAAVQAMIKEPDASKLALVERAIGAEKNTPRFSSSRKMLVLASSKK